MRVIDWDAEFAAMPYPHDPSLYEIAADHYEQYAEKEEDWSEATHLRLKALFWGWVAEEGWAPEKWGVTGWWWNTGPWATDDEFEHGTPLSSVLPKDLFDAMPEADEGNKGTQMGCLMWGDEARAWDALFVAWQKVVHFPSLSKQKEAVQ